MTFDLLLVPVIVIIVSPVDDSSQCRWYSEDISTSNPGQVSSANKMHKSWSL